MLREGKTLALVHRGREWPRIKAQFCLIPVYPLNYNKLPLLIIATIICVVFEDLQVSILM